MFQLGSRHSGVRVDPHTTSHAIKSFSIVHSQACKCNIIILFMSSGLVSITVCDFMCYF